MSDFMLSAVWSVLTQMNTWR